MPPQGAEKRPQMATITPQVQIAPALGLIRAGVHRIRPAVQLRRLAVAAIR